MFTDYIVSSLPSLAFGAPAPMPWEKFAEACGGEENALGCIAESGWADLETQMRNAIAEARAPGRTDFRRPATGCSLYWRNRVLACFQEKDVLRREELLDKTWWDAAGELTPPTSPLGRGALATYALRLRIALRRDMMSAEKGNAAFERLTAETKRPTISQKPENGNLP